MPVLTKINTNSIAEDAITGDKFAGDAYLANTANQNISGTYSENRLYTSDAYTLSGNATVNGHLTLSSIKPTADVVLTAGGAYTLTGTGVLSAGSLLAPSTTDLTGMTGELGSSVTGGSGLTALGTVTAGILGNGVKLGNESIRTSATNPSTITFTSKLASGDAVCDETLLWGSANALIHNATVTEINLEFDYGSGNTKYISNISWYQHDGAGNSTGIRFQGSANGSSWTTLSTVTSAIVNGSNYSYSTTSDSGYRYFRLNYTWSSGNYCSIANLRITERDEATIHKPEIGTGTTFPAGHIIQIRDVVTGVTENSNSQTYQDFMEDTITFTAGNAILTYASFSYFLSGGGADGGGYARLYDETGDTELCIKNTYINASSGGSTELSAEMSLIDKRVFSGTSVQIKLQYRGANGATVYIGSESKLILMEVQV